MPAAWTSSWCGRWSSATATTPQLLELERILHPRIVRRTGQQTGEPYDGFVDWVWKHQVAYGFAELVALPHDVWLRWRDDLSDEEDWIQHGAVKVGS
jgi:hypothetical protein